MLTKTMTDEQLAELVNRAEHGEDMSRLFDDIRDYLWEKGFTRNGVDGSLQPPDTW